MNIFAKLGNSIEEVRIRTMRIFALIALVSSFFVFFAFSLRLVWQEEAQTEDHLKSFQGIAEQVYRLSPRTRLEISEYVTVYYGESDFTEQLRVLAPIALNSVDRLNYEFKFSAEHFIQPGVVAYHFAFDYQGNSIQTYITINSFKMDLWDDNWNVLMMISTLLMMFLIIVLRIALKRVFDRLMLPISDLSHQLREQASEHFTVPAHSVDELKQLTDHLNQYSSMKDRVAKQELMFAKYASHELKTPISIVLSAAELQEMKPDDKDFQAKQRQRILSATNGMKETVEALLNIVKQENASTESIVTVIDEACIDLSKYQPMLASGVTLSLEIAPNTRLNMPLTLVNMVLKNYIENAIRFTVQGSITVRISSERISVCDSGIGLHSDTTIDHGLGLIIVSRIGKSYGWQSSLLNNRDVTGQPGCLALFEKQC